MTIDQITELIFPSTLIMPRPRSSKLPAVTPTAPGELTRKIKSPPQGDSRALVASSTAIALSIASPFCDIRGMLSDGDTVQGRDMNWQTTYNTARMAVEIAKETSDMFLPLKAVAGAVSTLIKNYDVSASHRRAEPLLILYLFLILANLGQYGDGGGDTTEGAVTIGCASLSCKRGRLCGEREKSRTLEVCVHMN